MQRGRCAAKVKKQIQTHKIIGAQGSLLVSSFDPPNWPCISFGLRGAICELAATEAEKVPRGRSTVRPAELRPEAEQHDALVRLCRRHHRAVRLFGNQWTVANIRTLCQVVCEHGRSAATPEMKTIYNTRGEVVSLIPSRAGNTTRDCQQKRLTCRMGAYWRCEGKEKSDSGSPWTADSLEPTKRETY